VTIGLSRRNGSRADFRFSILIFGEQISESVNISFLCVVTRREDGSLRANFRPLKIDKDFSVERFALGVYNELCMALGGLVEG